MRLILYTGKGGVGKSSIAAATAVRTAELGRRTLLVSLDDYRLFRRTGATVPR